MLDPRIVGQEHYDIATATQRLLQDYKGLQDIIAILGMDELSEADKLTVERARKVQRFMSQVRPSPSSSPSSRMSGSLTSRSSPSSPSPFPPLPLILLLSLDSYRRIRPRLDSTRLAAAGPPLARCSRSRSPRSSPVSRVASCRSRRRSSRSRPSLPASTTTSRRTPSTCASSAFVLVRLVLLLLALLTRALPPTAGSVTRRMSRLRLRSLPPSSRPVTKRRRRALVVPRRRRRVPSPSLLPRSEKSSIWVCDTSLDGCDAPQSQRERQRERERESRE